MKKMISTVAVTVLAGALLAGCGSDDAQTTAANDTAQTAAVETTAAETEDVEVKTVLIGTSGSTKHYIYTDENDNLIGYDAEIIYAIDELLPEYDFEFETTDFSSIFLGIDSGRYQMGVNNISWKEERAEKYLFSDEYVCYNYTGAVVRKDDTSVTTLEDLAGKKTYSGTSGLFSQLFIEKFNETHQDNPIEQIYTEADTIKQYQDLVDGVVDFSFSESVMFDAYLEGYPELKESLSFVTFSEEETASIQDPYTWFIYPKTDEGEELKEAVDGALRQLKEDGTVTELALKYIGYDTVGK